MQIEEINSTEKLCDTISSGSLTPYEIWYAIENSAITISWYSEQTIKSVVLISQTTLFIIKSLSVTEILIIGRMIVLQSLICSFGSRYNKNWQLIWV